MKSFFGSAADVATIAKEQSKNLAQMLSGKKASEDPISAGVYTQVRRMEEATREYQSQYKKTQAAWEEFNKEQAKLVSIGIDFYLDDEELGKNKFRDSMEEYDDITKAVVEEVPTTLEDVMSSQFLVPINKWHEKIFDHWKDLEALQQQRLAYDHYVEKTEGLLAERNETRMKGKSETPAQTEKVSRNQSKLQEAEEEYISNRDQLGDDSDEFLVGGKAKFLKYMVLVMQFQQQVYRKSAERIEKLDDVISACKESMDLPEAFWGEISYRDNKKQVEDASGGDENKSRTKKLLKDAGGGRRHKKNKKKAKDESASEESEDDSSSRKSKAKAKDKPKDKEKRRSKKHESSGEESEEEERPRGRRGKKDREVDISSIPESHIQKLLQDRSLAERFDDQYGEGAAAACLKRGPAIMDVPQAHIDKLLANPNFAPDFDRVYGAGSSTKYLALGGPSAPFALEATPVVINGHTIHPDHIERLKHNPGMAEQFDKKYGAGAASQVLGGESRNSQQDFDDILAW